MRLNDASRYILLGFTAAWDAEMDDGYRVGPLMYDEKADPDYQDPIEPQYEWEGMTAEQARDKVLELHRQYSHLIGQRVSHS